MSNLISHCGKLKEISLVCSAVVRKILEEARNLRLSEDEAERQRQVREYCEWTTKEIEALEQILKRWNPCVDLSEVLKITRVSGCQSCTNTAAGEVWVTDAEAVLGHTETVVMVLGEALCDPRYVDLWCGIPAAMAINAAVRGASQDEPLPDGPEPPDGFSYGGQTYQGLARKPFAAVQFVWACDNKTAHRFDLAEPVWQDQAFDVADNAMQGLRKEINRFFRNKKIPWHAKVKGDYLFLREGAPRESTVKPPAKSAKSKASRRRSH
jgi:hypothetical protein